MRAHQLTSIRHFTLQLAEPFRKPGGRAGHRFDWRARVATRFTPELYTAIMSNDCSYERGCVRKKPHRCLYQLCAPHVNKYATALNVVVLLSSDIPSNIRKCV